MKRALITGITGQDGSYLAELLLAEGYEVHGLIRRSSTSGTWRIDHILNQLKMHWGDMTDAGALTELVGRIKPSEIYNLAAQSHVGTSFDTPGYTMQVNALGPLYLLEAIRGHDLTCRFYQASTSELYGEVKEVVQDEETPFNPRSPYAIAKLAAYWTVRHYRETYGIHASNGILFNHESPRRGEDFVTKKICREAVRLHLSDTKTPPLRLGNLDAKRDWGFAGDYVRGMYLMVQYDEPGDYVLATGGAHSVRDFVCKAFGALDTTLHWVGEGAAERAYDSQGLLLVEVDPKFYRPAEVEFLLGCSAKARRVLGWQRGVVIDDLVEMMVQAELEAANG